MVKECLPAGRIHTVVHGEQSGCVRPDLKMASESGKNSCEATAVVGGEPDSWIVGDAIEDVVLQAGWWFVSDAEEKFLIEYGPQGGSPIRLQSHAAIHREYRLRISGSAEGKLLIGEFVRRIE